MVVECREAQGESLRALLTGPACPQAIAVHGASNTGKTLTLRSSLHSMEPPLNYTWISCDQCPTTRVMLQRALAHILTSTGTGLTEEASCENVDIFLSVLATKFTPANYRHRHVLVLDRIDELSDSRAQADVMYGLTRLAELYPSLTQVSVVFVYSRPEPRAFVSNPGIPRVWFPRYTLHQSLKLLQNDSELLPGLNSASNEIFRREFLELLVNALSPFLGSDLLALKRATRKIFPRFVENENQQQPESTVAQLYMRQPYLFQPEFVVDRLIDDEVGSSALNQHTNETISGYLLCAAYLASYNPSRYDMRSFSLAKSMRNKRRETRPKKSATIPARSLAPPAFEMERFLAIFHSILPNAFVYQSNVDVGRQIATLSAQNLILRQQNDILDTRAKWKINVSWSYVQLVAEKIGFEIEHYLIDDV